MISRNPSECDHTGKVQIVASTWSRDGRGEKYRCVECGAAMRAADMRRNIAAFNRRISA